MKTPRKIAQFVDDIGGLSVVDVQKSKHWKVRVARADGATHLLIFPDTSSDCRGMLNLRSEARKFARR